jgi:hypothetical protein
VIFVLAKDGNNDDDVVCNETAKALVKDLGFVEGLHEIANIKVGETITIHCCKTTHSESNIYSFSAVTALFVVVPTQCVFEDSWRKHFSILTTKRKTGRQPSEQGRHLRALKPRVSKRPLLLVCTRAVILSYHSHSSIDPTSFFHLREWHLEHSRIIGQCWLWQRAYINMSRPVNRVDVASEVVLMGGPTLPDLEQNSY